MNLDVEGTKNKIKELQLLGRAWDRHLVRPTVVGLVLTWQAW